MWPFITCGRSLSVMISLHSKPDLGKGNTTFTLVSRKFKKKKKKKIRTQYSFEIISNIDIVINGGNCIPVSGLCVCLCYF